MNCEQTIVKFNFGIHNEFLNQKHFGHKKLISNPHYKTFDINVEQAY